MKDIQQRKASIDQITALVQGFVQLWIKFEGMLHNELAKKHNLTITNSRSKETQHELDYGLFYRVSNSIYPADALTMGELSNALAVPLSTATRITNWLVANNFVERLPDPEDRRVVRVALTETGKELHQTLEKYTEEQVEKVLDSLSAEEQVMLLTLIGKVFSALKKIAV
jgi:DNA-binding MarR family transcriptional regulator